MKASYYARFASNTLDTVEELDNGWTIRVAFHHGDGEWQSTRPIVALYISHRDPLDPTSPLLAKVASSGCVGGANWELQCDAYTRAAEFVRRAGLETA